MPLRRLPPHDGAEVRGPRGGGARRDSGRPAGELRSAAAGARGRAQGLGIATNRESMFLPERRREKRNGRPHVLLLVARREALNAARLPVLLRDSGCRITL